MKSAPTERVLGPDGFFQDVPVHDGVREFQEREILTADRMNDMLRLTSIASSRARKATRLLWLSIVLTVIDLTLFVVGLVLL